MGTDPAALALQGSTESLHPGQPGEGCAGCAGSGSFASPVSLLAAASWEWLGTRRGKDEIRKGEKPPRGAAYYLTLSFPQAKRDSLAQRFNLV